MKTKNARHILKSIAKDKLPIFSEDDVKRLTTQYRDSPDRAEAVSECNSFTQFKIPDAVKCPRTALRPTSRKNTPLIKNKHESPWNSRIHTPALGDNIAVLPVTPFLYNLCSASPLTSMLPQDMLSTPSLFPVKNDHGISDILQMIDNDDAPVIHISTKLQTYNFQPVSDDNVADYVLDLVDDFQFTQQLRQPPERRTTTRSSLRPVPSSALKRRRGRYGKRMTRDVKVAVTSNQRQKAREKRQTEKTASCHEVSTGRRTTRSTSRAMDRMQENIDSLKRKVKACGTRTRSMVKACKEMGLARTEDEIDALLKRVDTDTEE